MAIKPMTEHLSMFLGYWLLGGLGLLLAIAPGYASPVFPAAGFALTSVLLGGYRLLPATFLGSFALNISHVALRGHLDINAVTLAVIIGLSAASQAAAGAYLVKRALPAAWKTLLNERQIVGFLLFGAIFPCLIAASVSVTALLIAGVIEQSEFSFSWWSWYLGDTLGVVVFSPLTLVLKQKEERQGERRRILLPMVSILFVVGVVFYQSSRWEKLSLVSQLQQKAKGVAEVISNRMSANYEAVESLHHFVLAAEPITRERFTIFSRLLLKKHPDIAALSINDHVQNADRDNYEAWLSTQYGASGPHYKIMQWQANQRLVVAERKDYYLPVRFIEPYEYNYRAVGFDIYSESVRRLAIDEALKTRKLTITGPIHLVQDETSAPGILEIWPVFASDRDQTPSSYAVGVVKLAAMLDSAIGYNAWSNNLHISLRDEDSSANAALIYENKTVPINVRNGSEYNITLRLPIENRVWMLMVSPSRTYLAEERKWISWAVGVFGFLFSGLLQMMLLGATGRSVELKIQNEKIRSNEQRYIKMFNDCPLPIWLYAVQSKKFILINERVAEHYGWVASEMLSLTHDVIMDNSWPVQTISTTTNSDGVLSTLFQCRHRKSDGSVIEVSVNSTPAYWEGEPAILEVIQDITAEKQMQEKLSLAAKVFDNCGAGILVTDASCAILAVNPTFSMVTGYSLSECIGKNPKFLNSRQNPPWTFERMWSSLIENDRWQGELYNKKKNGDIYQELLSIHVVRNGTGEITHYVGAFSDITEFKKVQRQISFMAFHDPLTKLLNRQAAIDNISGRLLRKNNKIQPFAVMFMDVDKFKFINDAYGHTTGDYLLVEVSLRLMNTIGVNDALFRLSGDEFLIVIDGAHEQYFISDVCERIRHAFIDPVRINDRVMNVSVSIGIAMAPGDGEDTEVLLRNADTAMYEAKQGGRNTYRFFNQQMNVNNQNYMMISAELRRAIAQQEFELYYQPQYHIATKQIVGMEALIRWNDPYVGMRSPVEFISIAEENGLIVPIGSWVIGEACKEAKKWLDMGLQFGRVAVNCSAAQFRLHDIEQDVIQALTHSGLPARFLELELTESILLQKVDDVLSTLIKLKNYGVHLSIDDFGTGYSSLAYLQQFRVDKLKIDQSFTRGITEQLDHLAIVQAIIQLAHGMNLSAIAEGVETEEVLDILRELGCDEIQGYLFSKPIPAEKVPSLLRHPPVMAS